MPKPIFCLRLEPEIRAALERAAKADGRPASALARKIIADWLRKQEKRA
jgi:predicted transcriptional regulator